MHLFPELEDPILASKFLRVHFFYQKLPKNLIYLNQVVTSTTFEQIVFVQQQIPKNAPATKKFSRIFSKNHSTKN